jgi:oligopeptide/dipeptide ABC transporter ATP-binding protein
MADIISVNNLKTYYYSKKKIVPAVDGVSFSMEKGEVLGIVGESGCGKSTVVRSIMGLLDKAYTRIEEGEVIFHDQDILKISEKELCKIRGKYITMIFQNPLSYLNPVYTVGDQVIEVILAHEKLSYDLARQRAIALMEQVKIPQPEMRFNDYPHQLSGGMQQRILIAIALANLPEIIIADEPTTAVDVTIQAQLLDLITQIRNEYNMSVILITHNMGIVAEMCSRILVMYGGVVVEEGMIEDVFAKPLHPYTKGLLDAIPNINEDKEELYTIPGQVPVFNHPVKQCRFVGRCQSAFEKCQGQEPPLYDLGGRHHARCWLLENEIKSFIGQQN